MREIKFTDKAGKKRKGFLSNCKVCKKEFISRKDQPQTVCSVECRAKSKENRVLITCAFCKKEVSKAASKLTASKSGIHFCSRSCKDTAQRMENRMTAIWPSSYKGGNHIDYRKLIEIDKCCDCQEKRKYLLVVHHIDGDRSNNERGNLEVVCGNCHTKRHLRNINGEWIYDGKSLTPRELLASL